jgi:hypothetical protein
MSRPSGNYLTRQSSLMPRRRAKLAGAVPRRVPRHVPRPELFRFLRSSWRWAALPLGVLYLVLLAARFRGVIATTSLDADTVSAPVIGELFGGAGAHATVVLGTFGWYSTLLFELATKWLPLHREIWEVAPYVMALAGAALTAWSVWQIAGRWAAGLTAVLLICAAPQTLHLLLSTTQHGPDWFCCALLAASLVLLQRRAATLPPPLLVSLAVVVGIIVGLNAASDVLVTIAGLIPFVLAVLATHLRAPNRGSARVLRLTVLLLAVVGATWGITAAAMSASSIGPQPGLNTTKLASLSHIASNFKLWWQSIATLGNGDYFGRDPSFSSGLAVACAALSITAVALLPRLGWVELRRRGAPQGFPAAPDRLAFVVFWCSSAILLTAAFLLSALPLDIQADRYLVGLVYAAAAVIPVLAVGRPLTEAAALVGTCVFALSGITSSVQGVYTRNTFRSPSTGLARQVASVAAAHHLKYGYAGYWDASPITWATHLRVQVYPVSVCAQNAHLCRFDLHFISSWYTPRPGIQSFLLIDPAQPLVRGPTPDLGPPAAVYHVGRIVMYAYPYDLATRIVSLQR